MKLSSHLPLLKRCGRLFFDLLSKPVIKKYRKFSDEKTKEFLSKLQKDATLIFPTDKIRVIKEDPADGEFIIAALEGQVDYIVTGDQHLLELGSYENIKIVSPGEFVKILEAQEK